MNLSAIFTAAHATARTATTGTYRMRFAAGLKVAYAATKAPAAPVEVVFAVPYSKADMPCSYKQYDYLYSFDNVVSMAGLNGTQFQKRVPVYMASAAIAAAQAGQTVRFVLA